MAGAPLEGETGEAEPVAVFGDRIFRNPVEVSHDPAVLDGSGTWLVVVTFEGEVILVRFGEVLGPPTPEDELGGDLVAGATRSPPRTGPGDLGGAWGGVPRDAWRSSMDEAAFTAGVRHIREAIGAGDVYQVNLCRVLAAPRPVPGDVVALGRLLAAGNPAPFAATVRVPEAGLELACASPERFLSRDGEAIRSSPIKGTAARASALTDKDTAENVMITDLVRNDLGRVCAWGSVEVEALVATEAHPGLVHLVSSVVGRLRPGVTWREVLAATFPPGSVSGAPKLAALETIATLEPVSRGAYCGAIGWVDADADTAELAVGIRTFACDGSTVRFGTGGGITWGSEPELEWAETELKARTLLGIAARRPDRRAASARLGGDDDRRR